MFKSKRVFIFTNPINLFITTCYLYYMMLFLDYSFFLLVDGSIALDDELQPEQLQIVDGDRFIASVIDGKIVLKKVRTSLQHPDTL